MIVETIRLSEKAKNQLIQLKRRTGIDHWNVLCRWALMLSLREKHPPPKEKIITDSSIEIAWRTFAGIMDPAITAVVIYKFESEKKAVKDVDLESFIKLHMHRGISLLSSQDDCELPAMLRLTCSGSSLV